MEIGIDFGKGESWSVPMMSCKPKHSPNTLDPWCGEHERSVICCTEELRSRLESKETKLYRIGQLADKVPCACRNSGLDNFVQCPRCRIMELLAGSQ